MKDPASRADARPFPMGFREFVALIAGMMAMNALSIDSMLPALPAMGTALHIADENSRVWIISAYILGFGAGQIVYGPLSDRFGRRPVLLIAILCYAVAAASVLLVHDFTGIIVVRLLQGAFAAATRVLAISIVRDRFEGRQMARVMSLAFIVFLTVPILAPSIGQLILLAGPWQTIFMIFAALALVLAGWAYIRLPETMHPEDRRPIDISSLGEAAAIVLGTRSSVGYTAASTLLFGGLMAYVGSSEQIFSETFGVPHLFTVLFAGAAAAMGAASYLNSRIVERIGTRKVSHSALIGFILLSAVHLALIYSGGETLVRFFVFQGLCMGCFSLATSNFNAMAMEEVGHVAGTAASLQGCFSTVIGGLVAAWIGQHFDGTTGPLVASYVLLGLASLAAVVITERGRLFRPHHPAGSPA